MPKRTNDFQKLIKMLTQLLGEGAVVEESKMLTDLVSGEDREVDIYAEGTLAGHTVNIGIECRDHQRKQGVEWVEQMRTKHERLPTNLLILVSSSGFAKSAIAKANSYGIKTIAPTRADSDLAAEVAASLGVTMKAWHITNMNGTITSTIPTEWLDRNPHGITQDDGQIPFYRSDGSLLVTSNDFYGPALGQHLAANPEWLAAADAADGEFELETPQMNGPGWHGEPLHVYWTADGEQAILLPVTIVVVRGRVRVLTEAVAVSPTGEIVYDGNRYLTGTAPMADGTQAQIVIADAQGQRRTQADFPVYIPPPEPENRAARRRRQRGG
jgi:hypothetical protein